MDSFMNRLNNTFMKELNEDPASVLPNRDSRAVTSGHYVRVLPKPLACPTVVSVQQTLSTELGLTEFNDEFARLFSGDVGELSCWSTPYAVSVYCQPIPEPDQFGGYGYGDGRACSIGQFQIENSEIELQLKGCGPTPFSRRFDGRAVLRSSVREFIVSEAMHAMGVPTTRALSLIVSGSDSVPRAWYATSIRSNGRKYPPNTVIEEQCAITCRGASSFLRVGQIELYQRRLLNGDKGAREEFEMFVDHVTTREFKEATQQCTTRSQRIIAMLKEFSKRQAKLVSNWIRVGYVQGNMNTDNCLLNGCTMDYGPFGFVGKYHPTWTPFTSDPQANFGFERQPKAAHVNVASLVEAVSLLVDDEHAKSLEEIFKVDFPTFFVAERNEMRRCKLGLSSWSEDMDSLLWDLVYSALDGKDYTIFWRELSSIEDSFFNATDQDIIDRFECAAYDPDDFESQKELCAWVRKWFEFTSKDSLSEQERHTLMKRHNPKYIPREWMLVEAYEQAQKGIYGPIEVLKQVLWNPYEEHSQHQDRFYRKTPSDHLSKPGSAFYS